MVLTVLEGIYDMRLVEINEFRGNDDTDADADAETTDERLDAR